MKKLVINKRVAYASITATPEKLAGEVPGQKLAPIVGGFHRGSPGEYFGQVFERVPSISFGRFYERV